MMMFGGASFKTSFVAVWLSTTLLLLIIITIINSNYYSVGAVKRTTSKTIHYVLTKTPKSALPSNFRTVLTTLTETVKCEAEQDDNGTVVATHIGQRQCSDACVQRTRTLIISLNGFFERTLLKANDMLNTNQSQSDIVVKFKPTIRSRCVRRKKKNKLRKKRRQLLLVCDCPVSVAMYGSSASKLIIDKAFAKLLSKSDSSSADHDIDIDIEALQAELWKLDDDDQNDETSDHTRPADMHNLQRRSNDRSHPHHVPYNPNHHYNYSPSPPRKSYVKEMFRSFHFLLLTALILVTVIVLHVPPLWIFIPVLILVWLIIK